MKTSSIAAVVGIALVGATAAWAQSAPDAPKGPPPHKPGEHGRMMHDPQRAQQHAKNFCVDRYAHAVGRMAYLEAKLDLNATQKPLYEKWSQTVLSGAAKDRDACAARVANFKPGASKPSILDRETRLEQMMTAKLETMKAQRPSLEALYASLTPDQQAQFNKPFGGHHGGWQRHGGNDQRPHRM
jgi:Spy/CpxP family protein refolding chaperone